MAAFASYRRSGWVRFLVVLLCALFVFATLGAPAARAEALTVGLFTAAAVLSAATAALGFKLAKSEQGQATLAKMVQDFKVSATAVGLVLVGSKINGLIDGVDYIKMQVKAGKTYLDERVIAWVQQWLGVNGVYNSLSVNVPEFAEEQSVDFVGYSLDDLLSFYPVITGRPLPSATNFILNNWGLKDVDLIGRAIYIDEDGYIFVSDAVYTGTKFSARPSNGVFYPDVDGTFYYMDNPFGNFYKLGVIESYSVVFNIIGQYGNFNQINNIASLDIQSNNTGLSGSDTIGKDVVDKTLDETLAGLKEWARDWWDAGADSSTNGAAAGAKDLEIRRGA